MATPNSGLKSEFVASGLGGRPGYLLIKLGELLRQKADEALEPLGLNARRYNLMAMVRADPLLSQREISVLLGLDANIVVALIDQLERAGLVVRTRNPADRRRHVLQISPSGSTTIIKADELVAAAEKTWFFPLTKLQLDTVSKAAAKVLQSHRAAEAAGKMTR